MSPHSEKPLPFGYSIIIPPETLSRAADYLKALQAGRATAGALLADQLGRKELKSLQALDLLGKLFDTKQPQIFAEMAVAGDGSDWNLTELGLLGDISIAAPVTLFDNGNHSTPVLHEPPFEGFLIFTPGALLRNGQGETPADWNDVVREDGTLCSEGYYSLYLRRLLPVFRYVNERAGTPRSALLTVPGIGCGQFAGPFHGQLGEKLQGVLERILREFGKSFPNIKALYFDPYSECDNYRRDINGIAFMVRPFRASGNHEKSQLCHPSTFAERGDDFSSCTLFSIVAWDHVSWPGNDFYAGSRATDDGVKAAASNSMSVFTGVPGSYDPARGKYLPPAPYSIWREVVGERVRKGRLRLWAPKAIWQPG